MERSTSRDDECCRHVEQGFVIHFAFSTSLAWGMHHVDCVSGGLDV